uniref:Uncharacterized protein n=1 Tax=viral metagenome TaxID=1070528 RepID=A0A6C0ADP6_9ZZZZ
MSETQLLNEFLVKKSGIIMRNNNSQDHLNILVKIKPYFGENSSLFGYNISRKYQNNNLSYFFEIRDRFEKLMKRLKFKEIYFPRNFIKEGIFKQYFFKRGKKTLFLILSFDDNKKVFESFEDNEKYFCNYLDNMYFFES